MLDLERIRRTIITAVAADDRLGDTLVLKGGNALHLVHGISARSSVDFDYSIETDFAELSEIKARMENSLNDRFAPLGVTVEDFEFVRKPAEPSEDPEWGGYEATFKLIPDDVLAEHRDNRERLGVRALSADARHRKTFAIQISKHEHTAGAVEVVMDAFNVSVYTPEMIAAEKLRAICQQRSDYPPMKYPWPRPRDFYDICAILDAGVELPTPEWEELLAKVFAAKKVPLNWLHEITEHRAFHRQDWPSVRDAIGLETKPFDYYVDRVIELCESLETAGIEDAPG